MTTGSFTRTSLNDVHYVVQNTQNNYVKDVIIGVLRDEFAKDSFYHFVKDEFGYPKTPDLTNIPLTAGINDDLTTRIFIGESFRHDAIFYPAIFVKMGTMSDVPISINREKETVKYSAILVYDGYGNSKTFTVPTHFVFAGAWEGSVNLEIFSRDILERDELSAISSLILRDIRYEELLRAGILIKRVSISAPSEMQDREQEVLYKNTVTAEIRTEWRREIPVESTVDAVNFCIEFGRLDTPQAVIAPNLTINTNINVLEQIEAL